MKNSRFRPYLYPFFFGLYPLLSLMAGNLNQAPLASLWRPLLVSAGFGLLIVLLFHLIYRDRQRAALGAMLTFLLFYSYGHVYQLIEGASLLGFNLGRHRYFGLVWLVLYAAGLGWIARRGARAAGWNRALTVATTALLLFSAGQIAIFQMRLGSAAQPVASAAPGETAPADPSRPDVYLFILDGYTRDDVLQAFYDYDNTPFLRELKQRGFSLPACAQSNYAVTALSLPSLLNMNYIDTFTPAAALNGQEPDFVAVSEQFRQNKVRRRLEKLGYTTVAFENNYWWSNLRDAEVYFRPDPEHSAGAGQGLEITPFEFMYLQTTLLRIPSEARQVFFDRFASLAQTEVRSPHRLHYDDVLYSLAQAETVPAGVASPKFVYLHIVAPHSPHVIDARGNFVEESVEKSGYPAEVQYINRRVLKLVDLILARPGPAPIIIIQGDHGMTFERRMPILNAYYLPNGGAADLYPTITPVNSFRLIFNRYFDAQDPLLEDRSFYSDFDGVYRLKPVSSTCSPFLETLAQEP